MTRNYAVGQRGLKYLCATQKELKFCKELHEGKPNIAAYQLHVSSSSDFKYGKLVYQAIFCAIWDPAVGCRLQSSLSKHGRALFTCLAFFVRMSKLTAESGHLEVEVTLVYLFNASVN